MILLKDILDKIKPSIPPIDVICIELLIESYNMIVHSKEYDLDWDEEQFSAHIISNMNKHPLTKKHHLHIDIEKKLLNKDKLPINENNPKYLPRIDISIASWILKKDEKTTYFLEAKNLYENNYKSKISSKYLNRYIDTGIENFRVGKYTNGSLIGYVLNGKISNIINKLNIQLKKDRQNYNASTCINTLEKSDLIQNCSTCYESMHYIDEYENICIKHMFLKF